MQHIEIHSSVEKGTGPKWGGEKEGDLSLHYFFLAPNALSHIPSSTLGRWLQILVGPLSIPLANSHIPEQHMFHLKPTRFVLLRRAKEKTLAQAANFLGEVGVREIEAVILRNI